MLVWFTANLAPIMFGSLIVFLLIGFPVAFSLGAVGLVYAVIGIEIGAFHEDFLQALPERVFGNMANETLLAVPFFTFMGLILERSGMAEDLLDTIGQLFGSVRGGLAYAVVFVGALLAATTGVVAASVISMGLISLPIMLRYGYDRRLAAGVIAASGTLSQIIPPSLVLIVMADQLGRSVGDMYEGALIPGLMLTVFYALYVFIVSLVAPRAAPALPPEARTIREDDGSTGLLSLIAIVLLIAVVGVGTYRIAVARDWATAGGNAGILGVAAGVFVGYVLALINRVLRLGILSRMAETVVIVMVPPLALIFLVLGTIFLGIATPTEGGAMGAAGALILALAKRRLGLKLLTQALDSTAKLSSFVIFILFGSRVFSLTFYGVNGHLWVEHLLTGLPGGQIGFLIVTDLLVFFLAFFLDFFELAFIVVPLLAPAASALGIDLVWFGVILGVNMQTSFMHPPFGFALFYLRSVAPTEPYRDRVTGRLMDGVRTGQIYWGAMPFVFIQLVMVILVIVFPYLVTHYKAANKVIDLDKAPIQMPSLDSFGGTGFNLGPLPSAPAGK